jgi:hypothetical protein
MATFQILDEIPHPHHPPGGWRLWFQLVRLYGAGDDGPQDGVRFNWRDDNGRQSSRPCRVDSVADMLLLISLGLAKGWGTTDGGIHGVVRQPLEVAIDGEHWTLFPATPSQPLGTQMRPYSNEELAQIRAEVRQEVRDELMQWMEKRLAAIEAKLGLDAFAVMPLQGADKAA